jgi:hypothetical protein
MAKTLNEFKKEFEAIKKLAHESVETIEAADHNLDTHRDHLNEQFPALGLRIHALRDAGQVGTKIEDFMGDKELAVMVKELSNRRETAKKTALEAAHARTVGYKPVTQRLNALEKAITDEIAARGKKTTGTVLNLNQSVKEMTPLLNDVKAYRKHADIQAIVNDAGSMAPAQFDRLYTLLLTKELNKSKDEAVKAEQLMLKKQKLNDKVMKGAFSKANAAYAELDKQAKLAKTAQLAKDITALAAAKKAGAAALVKIDLVVKPYKDLLKDPEIIKTLSNSPDKPGIDKNAKALFDLKDHAKNLLGEIESRRLV